MLKNYLTIALRNLRRQSGFTAINIAGLSIGLACCILIMLFVRDELSYDRFFDDSDRIYRVAIDGRIGEQEILAPVSPAPLIAAFEESFPEVEVAARIFRSEFHGAEGVLVGYGDHRFIEKRLYYVDSTFFDVFSYTLKSGNPTTALSAPNSIVLTETTARKYFGTVEAVGQVVRIDNQFDYRVTGVVEDPPAQTHWKFDVLASLVSLPISNSTRWLGNPFSTYFLLREGHNAADLEVKLGEYVDRIVGPQLLEVFGMSMEQFSASGGRYRYYTQPLTDIHLESGLEYELGVNSDIRYVYTFIAVAFLILSIACFNFVNLSTARSARRAREVGIRKVLGSGRRQLTIQFLGEALVLCSMSMVLALSLVQGILPGFNELVGKSISVPYSQGYFLPLIAGFTLVVSLLAGVYPAIFLTSFKITHVLKGKMLTGGTSNRFRSSLVVLQFAITIALMIGTAVVFQQIGYTQTKRLGFDKEHVVVLDRGMALGQQRDAFKQELLAMPGVVSASSVDNLPGSTMGDDSFRAVDAPADQLKLTWMLYADDDVIETMGMNIVDGRDFTQGDSAVLILNRTAVEMFGWDNPVGKQIASPFAGANMPDRIYDVVGVVEDFHFESLHEEIRPLAIELASGYVPEFLVVRVGPEDVAATLEAIETSWQEFVPREPFSYSFLDNNLETLYRTDRQTGRLIGIFAALAMLIACLGLFGLAAFMAEKRVKEVGIRKVMGASTAGIVGLFAKEFVWLVSIAFFIAAPMAYFAVNRWLESFAYRIDINASIFVATGALAMLIAFLTVSYQSMRAAQSNPVEALRRE